MPISEKAASRGCYELRLGNDSILAWLLENHTQVTFPAKSGRLLPLIWRSFERTLLSATTSCARSSTGSEVDCENRLCMALHATRPATVGSCIPAEEEVALCWRLRGDGSRFARAFATFGEPSARSDGGDTRLSHSALRS